MHPKRVFCTVFRYVSRTHVPTRFLTQLVKEFLCDESTNGSTNVYLIGFSVLMNLLVLTLGHTAALTLFLLPFP